MDIIWGILGLIITLVIGYLLIQAVAFLIGAVAFFISAALIPGVIGGVLTFWWFDTFWVGFIVGGIIGIIFLLSGNSNPVSSSPSRPVSTSPSSQRRDSYSSNQSNRSYDNDHSDSELQNKASSLKQNYEDAMYRYHQYKNDAERQFDQADTETRYAEDYDRRGREFDDESAIQYARDCYSNAACYTRDGQQLASEAQYYYNQAQGYKQDLSAIGIYVS